MRKQLSGENSSELKNNYILITTRYILIFCCLVLTLIPETDDIPSSSPVDYRSIRALLIFMFILNTSYLLFLNVTKQNLTRFIIFQVIVDLIIETFLIYITGGILSMFVSLYFASILSCGGLVSMRGGLLSASFCTICISGITTLYFLAVLDNEVLPLLSQHPPLSFPKEEDIPFCRAYLIAHGVAFYMVAFLSGHLVVKLARERILHEEILQNMNEGVLVVDTRHNLVFINLTAKQLLELKGDGNFQGRSVRDVFNKEKHIDLLKALMLQKEMSYDIELISQKKKIPIHLSLSGIEIENRIKAYILILSDITDRKQMEEAVKKADRLSTIHEMSATIAHEIRNPLASIRGAIQELRESFPENDPRNLLMDISIRESDRLNRIVTEFLEFSHLRSPILQKCWFNHILDEVILFLQQRVKEFEGVIHSKVEEGLFVLADSGHLRQVFYNLGINAIEACEGQCKVTITASSMDLKEFSQKCKKNFYGDNVSLKGVYVNFQDSGKGVSLESLKKIFDPFFSTKTHGTGMGLAVVNQVLNTHKALIHIESIPQKGSCFMLWFPENLENLQKFTKIYRKDNTGN